MAISQDGGTPVNWMDLLLLEMMRMASDNNSGMEDLFSQNW